MGWLNKVERKFGRYAIPNVTVGLILGQVMFFVFAMSGRFVLERVLLIPDRVLAGEWWRLFTFLFIPPVRNPIFAFFAWYLFYLMGTALENRWGTFRYNLFLLIGWGITVAVSFLFPYYPATNIFIGGSVFLAFAHLYPEFQLYIFFILPVKIKWLALLTWISYAFQFITGSWSTRYLILASISNYLLFFGRDIYLSLRSGKRRIATHAREIASRNQPFHTCEKCGITDISNPKMEFRYCPECGGLGYCMNHIFDHEHVKKKD